jgi:anti-anti-sigma factor
MPTYSRTEEQLIISFTGKLDTATCIDFEDELYNQLKAVATTVIFDLNEVDYISSMFLRVCTKTAQKTGKENFSIINVAEPVMKLFKLTRLNSFLNISEKNVA